MKCSNEMLKRVEQTCLLARLWQGLVLLRAVMDRNRAVLLAGVRVLVGGTVTGWHLKRNNQRFTTCMQL